MILAILDGEKTKPIQTQTKPIRVSPQTCAGGWKAIWKNKANFEIVKLAQTLYWKEIMAINRLAEPKKTKPNKANRRALPGRYATSTGDGI